MVAKFVGCFDEPKQLKAGGKYEKDVIMKERELYVQMAGKKFQDEHA